MFDHVCSLIKGFSSLILSCKLNLGESSRPNLSVLPKVDSPSRVTYDLLIMY